MDYDDCKSMYFKIQKAINQLEDICKYTMFRIAKGEKYSSQNVIGLVEDMMKADVTLSDITFYLLGEMQDHDEGRYEPVPDPDPASGGNGSTTGEGSGEDS